MLQKRLRQNVDRYGEMLREHADENIQHILTELQVGITLDQDESHGLVDDWCELVSLLRKAIQKS